MKIQEIRKEGQRKIDEENKQLPTTTAATIFYYNILIQEQETTESLSLSLSIYVSISLSDSFSHTDTHTPKHTYITLTRTRNSKRGRSINSKLMRASRVSFKSVIVYRLSSPLSPHTLSSGDCVCGLYIRAIFVVVIS